MDAVLVSRFEKLQPACCVLGASCSTTRWADGGMHSSTSSATLSLAATATNCAPQADADAACQKASPPRQCWPPCLPLSSCQLAAMAAAAITTAAVVSTAAWTAAAMTAGICCPRRSEGEEVALIPAAARRPHGRQQKRVSQSVTGEHWQTAATDSLAPTPTH